MRNKLIKIIIISILVGLIEVLFSKSISLANFLLNKSNYYLIRFLPVAAFLIYYLCKNIEVFHFSFCFLYIKKYKLIIVSI